MWFDRSILAVFLLGLFFDVFLLGLALGIWLLGLLGFVLVISLPLGIFWLGLAVAIILFFRIRFTVDNLLRVLFLLSVAIGSSN